jgi:K+-sensing histidine kinase KdpD
MKRKRSVLRITLCMTVITAAHLLVPHHKIYLHVLLQFLYIIPILLAGKSGGRWYGLSAGGLSAVLYSPHFMFKEAPVVFHIEGVIWIFVFCAAGYMSGIYSDIKEDYLKLTYGDVSVDIKHKIGSILF